MAKTLILVAVATLALVGCAKEAEPETPAPTTTQATPAAKNTAPASFKGDMPRAGQAVPNNSNSNGMPTSGELSVNPNAKK